MSLHDLSTLFDMLPIGAYRAEPGGRIVRVNAALLAINGYASEAECLADTRTIGAESYVEPGRRERFRALLLAHGQVRDFVSETYRLKTGERIWVREHAHLVRGANGEPLYIDGTVEDITAERTANQALQGGESLLRSLIETIPDRVWLKDLKGIHLACNTAFAAHVGARPEDVVGTDDTFWFGKDAAREFQQTDRLTAHAGKTTSFEGPMPSPLGHDPAIYEVIKTPMFDAQGRIVGVLGMGRNIHARKEAERLLRDTSEQLELALMGADLGRWDHDLTTDKGYYLDERACAMLGRAASEAHIGRAWGHLIHPDDLPATLDAMRAHLSGGASAYEAEYRARHRDGHWVWLSNRGKVVQFSQDGKPLRMVGTLMDVTKRKQVEGELLATQAQLQATLQEIAELAFHDTLTNLPNRRLLMDRMETALTASLRHQRHGAVLFLDLDKFKHLNDNHGHEVGDLMLREVAQRLLLCVRSVDTVARLGGDEFVVLLQDLSGDPFEARLHASAVGHKILSSLNEPYRLNDTDHAITPSIGAVLFLGMDVAASELIRLADVAMFEAKAEGRNTFCFHQASVPK